MPRKCELISPHTITEDQPTAWPVSLCDISAHALTHTYTHSSTEAALESLGTSQSVGAQSLWRKSKISFYGL